jgi:hypothetical protein
VTVEVAEMAVEVGEGINGISRFRGIRWRVENECGYLWWLFFPDH